MLLNHWVRMNLHIFPVFCKPPTLAADCVQTISHFSKVVQQYTSPLHHAVEGKKKIRWLNVHYILFLSFSFQEAVQ